MSIPSQINDAKILLKNGSYEGALSNILMAIAGSSRRLYPRKVTKSIINPKDFMRDGEAFKLFLGIRIARILFCDYSRVDSGLGIDFRGKRYLIEDILYEQYRCNLLHESELPDDVGFVSCNPGITFSQGIGLTASISIGEKLTIDYGWLQVLMSAVINAPSNYDLFDNGYKRLETKENADIELKFESDLIKQYDISKGRYEILKEICAIIGVEDIKYQDYVELADLFKNQVVSRMSDYGLGQGIIIGLSSRGVCDNSGNLTKKGCDLIKKIAHFYS